MNQELKESLYTFLFQNLNDSVFLFEADEHGLPGRIIDANRAAWETRGYTRDELLQLTVRDLNTPQSAANISQVAADLQKQGSIQAEMTHHAKDGKIIPVAVSATLVHIKNKFYILSVVRDIAAFKHAQAEDVRRKAEHMRLALEAAQMIAWERDLKTGKLECSRNYAAYFDLTHVSSVDENLTHDNPDDAMLAVHPEDRALVLDAIEQAIANKTHFEIEFRGRARKDPKEQKWFLASGEAYFDAEGHPIRLMGVTKNITCRKQAQQKINQLLEQEQILRVAAESANRSKDIFLATLSHELRTPLTTILTWAQMIKSHNLSPEKAQRGIQMIEQSALFQVQLINDLLDISRMIAGKLTVHNGHLSPETTINAVIESLTLVALEKKIEIMRELEPSVVAIVADEARLKQVLLNLIGNAIKFTPPGGRIVVKLLRNGDHAELIVSDNGIGIDPEFLPHIFERFTQANSSSTQSHTGLGLGLAISSSLVTLMGGSIRAESSGAGKGSTFTITFPM